MINSSGSVEQWFADLSKETNMHEVIIVPFDISNGVLKMQERFILGFKNTPSELSEIKKQCLEKLDSDLEHIKAIQEYMETQIIMFARGECSYEELKRVALIVKEELSHK